MSSNNSFAGQRRPAHFSKFIGGSPIMCAVFDKIQKAACAKNPVFITGESGTGKEIAAQTLHHLSDRKDKPFIALNCAALPTGLVESALFGHVKGAFTGADTKRNGAIKEADGGTLFLDEICDMPIELQAKLLRFCQDFHYQHLGSDKIHKANIRLICATNKDPKVQIESQKFREDLYYRLYVMPIHLPPLRERGADVIDLAFYFLHQYRSENPCRVEDFSANTRQLMKRYHWPGNVRELQNLIHQLCASAMHPIIMETMLPDEIKKTAFCHSQKSLEGEKHISMPLWQIEKRAIENAIALCHGNIAKAAAMLDVAPSTIYRKKQLWEQK